MAALHPCTTRIRRGARPPSYTTLWGTTFTRIDVRCLTPSIDRGFTASGATWSSGNAGNRGRNLAGQAGRPVRVDGTGPEEVTADGSNVSRSSCLVGDERTSFIARPRFLLRARWCGRSSRIEHGVVGGCMHCRGFGSYDPQNTSGQRAAALRRCMAEASGVVRRSRVNSAVGDLRPTSS